MTEPARKVPQKKASGHRVRTGCTTCRSRRIKCDERRPSCRRCYIAQKRCEYSLDAALPSGGFVLAPECRDIVPVREAAPPDWDFMQTIRYYKTVIEPAQSSEFEPYCSMDDGFRYFSVDTRLVFICLSISSRISALGRNSGRLLAYGEREQALDGLWASYSRYMLLILDKINSGIRKTTNGAVIKKCAENSMVTYSLLNLLSCDLKVKGSHWRAHLNGYFAYMAQMGGMAKTMWHNRLQWQFCDLIVRVIKADTFTPAHQQLLNYEEYTESDIKLQVESSPSNDMPCPAALLVNIIQITKLRRRVALNPSLADTLGPAIQALFRDVEKFDVAEWAKGSLLGAKEMLPALGRLFQAAVYLHGLMTLPRRAVLEAHPSAPSYKSLCLQHRLCLMELLRGLFPTVKYCPALLWPVVVAGVAAGAADDRAAQDQAFVDDCLHRIWWQPASTGDPVYCIEKLRAFWQSGKTEWEECFYEPTPC